MKIISEISLRDFESWSGATETKNIIIQAGKEEEFEELIEELFPNGVSATELNDCLWFDQEYVLNTLGIDNSEDEE